MSDTAIKGIMDVTMDKIRAMADADTIIGKEIKLDNGIVIIPISKVSFGFASGGSDFPSKTNKELFGGGAGAGISVTPTAFIVINNNDVRMLQISKKADATDKAIDMLPALFDKVTALFKKDEDKPTV
ncbi:MAG: GerW family sporulation protein [Acutalibacteraceae bacterium]|nr:GerW family sporulation protein [Clostridia bacterium]MBQ2318715.1 GerW family sporulation protein [Clostridia bacterium]MBQ2421156.1 GerW family sporulation protein [Clostridia bacterium]MEE1128001.1 GerW family sporulation protein [Acutalibacteraceae bacterium]